MADNELSAEAGLHPLNPYVPGVYAKVGFLRRWRDRGTEFTEETATASGVDLQHLEQLVADDDELGDLYQQLIQRALGASDANYRRALARTLGRAVADRAKVDQMASLGDTLTRLQPADLRLFLHAYTPTFVNAVSVHERINPVRLSDALELTPQATDSSLSRLAAVGLVREAPDVGSIGEAVSAAMTDGGGPAGRASYTQWVTTAWGREAAALCTDMGVVIDKQPSRNISDERAT